MYEHGSYLYGGSFVFVCASEMIIYSSLFGANHFRQLFWHFCVEPNWRPTAHSADNFINHSLISVYFAGQISVDVV